MNQVRDWLANLSLRERNLVYAAAALLGVLLLYLVLILPFQATGRAHQQARRTESSEPGVDEGQGAARSSPRQARPSRAMAANRWWCWSIAPPVKQASPPRCATRVRTVKTGCVCASRRPRSTRWSCGSRSLQQQYGVAIDAATVDAAAPGLVNASLTLTKAAAAAG